ncbi:MAG: cobalamin-dependent protein [Flavobacteriales bacterium]|nr:cobalamin-dependent protein [Flavobacteriales bacterium]
MNSQLIMRAKIQKLELPERIGPARKVMLIVPPGTKEESYGRLSAAAGELPMLGLAFIAASLRDQGHEVKVFDYEVHRQNFEQVEADIQSFRPDVVGMTGYITNMRRCAATAELTKRLLPDAFVIIGGPQVSIFPKSGLDSPHVDLCVLSEGEVVIRNVLNVLAQGNEFSDVKGVAYRDESGEVVVNERESLVDDLDIFPSPALDLYDMNAYKPPTHVRGKKVAHLLSSRGCPFQCTFCETKLTFGQTLRYHSIEGVIREMGGLIQQGYDSFQFYDDISTLHQPRTKELCQAIIDKGWKIQWMCFTRTNCVSDELLSLMKKAGCYLITFGAESGNDELLKMIKKQVTVAKNLIGIQLTRKHKILASSSFMLGLPTETKEQTLKTIDFAMTSGLDYAVFPILEPYPGTELWDDCKKHGEFDSSGKYSNNLLSEESAVWIPKGRSREELEHMAQFAMMKFYFRPRQMFRMIENFYHLPPLRALQYIWSGVSYFIINRFKSARPGARF